MAARPTLDDADQAFAQVALDGAHVDVEVFGQLVLVEQVALVQLGQDVGQARGEFFALGAGA
ncbi:MAG: hypothetical protein Q4G71_04670 [Pseudomonadota bacterium]|nr:hypothetical protein [Pseudomonadota bacterium]